ncbi:DUF4232 domain-containing protein [Streptomyces chryseus]|uniref:DUF4232 domain-containing protein n=1 Tax=Streptomyces chryseus TaxID=68186 RepID=UPI00110F97CD|nr:DUF4232 domain-containing protein [Streptomyces chryseus]GGX19210.1 hypothetical protein GCM10010353_38010 [Streptomyces chryseus]
MRTFIHRPAALAASAVAALGLTLTACGAGDSTKDHRAAESVSVDTSAGGSDGGKEEPATGGEAASGTGTSGSGTSGTGTSGSSASGSTGSATQAGSRHKARGKAKAGSRHEARTKGAAKAPACAVDDVRISAAKQDGVPTTHLTLTAVNVSGYACTLLQYPVIAFGDVPQTAKDVPPVAKSRPAAPVVLNAGAPAYAAVRVNQGGVDDNNRVVTSFYVNLFAADGPAEGSKTVPAPKGGIAVDDAAAKTGYWTHELRDGADDF